MRRLIVNLREDVALSPSWLPLIFAVGGSEEREYNRAVTVNKLKGGWEEMEFTTLTELVSGNAAAVRFRMRMQPAAGQGSKVFPPTHSVDTGSKYALEDRYIDGKKTPCVLLDSVQSQANRMEMALLQAICDPVLKFPKMPILNVDFRETDLSDIGVISSYEAPHRIADAIFRDSELDKVPFRDSVIGTDFQQASIRFATPILRYCPTALLFGVWDSTGNKGGSGEKFQRALVSEIIGINATEGVSTSSRMDPLHIKRVEVFQANAGEYGWTLDKDKAIRNKKGEEKKLKASDINHSNIPPSLARESGGVTIERAELNSVLSFPALRKLRFPEKPGETSSPKRDIAGRTVVAAIGLSSMVLQLEQGFDLRSKCLLVPDAAFWQEMPHFEIINNSGKLEGFTLSLEDSIRMLDKAIQAAEDAGLPWEREPIMLKPSDKLIGLIKKSRATETAEED